VTIGTRYLTTFGYFTSWNCSSWDVLEFLPFQLILLKINRISETNNESVETLIARYVDPIAVVRLYVAGPHICKCTWFSRKSTCL